MADVEYHVAGNASNEGYIRGSGKYKFTCQHGQDECKANIYENCFLRMPGDKLTSLKSVACMFNRILHHKNPIPTNLAFLECANKFLEIDYTTWYGMILCGTEDHYKGLDFFDDAINLTPKDHTSIPWVIVEGITLTQDDRDSINSNVMEWVCQNYEGEKVEACTNQKNLMTIIDN